MDEANCHSGNGSSPNLSNKKLDEGYRNTGTFFIVAVYNGSAFFFSSNRYCNAHTIFVFFLRLT